MSRPPRNEGFDPGCTMCGACILYDVSCQQHYWFNHKKNNDLFLIHFNVRSLQKHIEQLNNYLVGFKNQPDIVAISESKLKEGLINRNIELECYGFLHSDSKKCAGEVGLYIKDTIKFR